MICMRNIWTITETINNFVFLVYKIAYQAPPGPTHVPGLGPTSPDSVAEPLPHLQIHSRRHCWILQLTFICSACACSISSCSFWTNALATNCCYSYFSTYFYFDSYFDASPPKPTKLIQTNETSFRRSLLNESYKLNKKRVPYTVFIKKDRTTVGVPLRLRLPKSGIPVISIKATVSPPSGRPGYPDRPIWYLMHTYSPGRDLLPTPDRPRAWTKTQMPMQFKNGMKLGSSTHM